MDTQWNIKPFEGDFRNFPEFRGLPYKFEDAARGIKPGTFLVIYRNKQSYYIVASAYHDLNWDQWWSNYVETQRNEAIWEVNKAAAKACIQIGINWTPSW